MLVVAPLVILIATIIIGLIVTLTGDALLSRERVVVTYEAQTALESIERDIHIGDQFLATSGTLPSPQGSNAGYTGTAAFASPSQQLIIQQYATTANPAEPDRTIVTYANQPNPCDSGGQYNTPVRTKIIYYRDGDTIKRRTIVPQLTASETCGSIWQRNSCTNGLDLTNQCRAKDEKVAQNISSFGIGYLNKASETTLYGAPTPNHTAVRVLLSASGGAAGRDVGITLNLLASLQNEP